MTRAERMARVECGQPALPIQRQREMLSLPRSSVYRKRGPAVSDGDLALMRFVDELHPQYPFMDSWRLRDKLAKCGQPLNREARND